MALSVAQKGDAPEIDGVVYVADAANLKPGDIVNEASLMPTITTSGPRKPQP